MWNVFNYEKKLLELRVMLILNVEDFFEIFCLILFFVEYVSFDCVDFLIVFFYLVNELY